MVNECATTGRLQAGNIFVTSASKVAVITPWFLPGAHVVSEFCRHFVGIKTPPPYIFCGLFCYVATHNSLGNKHDGVAVQLK